MIKIKGSTDVTTYYKLQSASTGAPATGLDPTTLDMTYVRTGAAAVKNDATALAAVDSSHGDNKIIEVDGTNAPGLYRADWPDACFATGVDDVQLIINGATIDPAVIEVQLDVENAVWDSILIGSTHNIATSAGRRLREIASMIIYSGTAQGPGTSTNQIQLDNGASSDDGSYDPGVVNIIEGTGAGQSRGILEYDGGTRTATVDQDWKVLPDSDSEFTLTPTFGRDHVNEGLARGGTLSSITLNALASSDPNAYVSQTCFIRSGTGADQAVIGMSYNPSTKVLDVAPDFDTAPDTTSGYTMLPVGLSSIVSVNGTAVTSPDDFKADITNLIAAAKGKVVRTGNVYEYYDTDNSTLLFTITLTANSRTVL